MVMKNLFILILIECLLKPRSLSPSLIVQQKPLNVITFSSDHEWYHYPNDYINYWFLFLEMEPSNYNYNKRLITLTAISWCGFHFASFCVISRLVGVFALRRLSLKPVSLPSCKFLLLRIKDSFSDYHIIFRKKINVLSHPIAHFWLIF